MIEDQNALLERFALLNFSRDRKSKHTWSDYEWQKAQMRAIKLRSTQSVHS